MSNDLDLARAARNRHVGIFVVFAVAVLGSLTAAAWVALGFAFLSLIGELATAWALAWKKAEQ